MKTSTPKTTFVYERKGIVYVLTHSRTTIGIWIAVNPCTALPIRSSALVIGDTVLRHLSASVVGIPHPTSEERRVMVEPFLKVAKVKSWNAFSNGARCVDISVESGTTKVTPMRNGKPGFFWLEEEAVVLSENVRVEGLGETILLALAKTE